LKKLLIIHTPRLLKKSSTAFHFAAYSGFRGIILFLENKVRMIAFLSLKIRIESAGVFGKLKMSMF
ncbi:MAG: hypothetical protein NUV91_09260, partial [Candidatus Omnitrophica bacterium]|nr:hypothetical protein [Candidatus Omnitrophota bacterium]